MSESARVAAARSRVEQRVAGERRALRPLGWVVVAVVTVEALTVTPSAGLQGKSLGISCALIVVAGSLLVAVQERFPRRSVAFQTGVVAVMASAGVALAALEQLNASGLAVGVAVWMAIARLPARTALPLVVGVIIALDAALVLSDAPGDAVLTITLVSTLLAVVSHFMRRARESEARMAVLLAQLEDAQEEQARAAAVAERTRIATELHDVLAHTLSGAAIQLQSARKLAQREEAGEGTRAAVDRAGQLVADGLASAREAVGALRGERLPGVSDLRELIDRFRRDTGADVTLVVEGEPVQLNPDAELALYRGTQEALTNIARYAPGAQTEVALRYADGRASLSVEDRVAARDGSQPDPGLERAGGGHGLAGLRQRVKDAGGAMRAGPTPTGWRVDVEVPS